MAKINVNNIDWEQEDEDQFEDQLRGGVVKGKSFKKKNQRRHDFDDGYYEPKNKKMNKPHRFNKEDFIDNE